MSFDKSNLDSYNDVASRIAEFRTKHPEGSLQPVDPSKPFDVVTIADKIFLVYAAAAYRTPEDQRPGIGVAWEPFPGRTPYTKDSEVMVLETSAWGRAIVAALAADTRKGIATREDVRNRQAEQEADTPRRGDEWETAQPRPQPERVQIVAKGSAAIAAATTKEQTDALAARVTLLEKQERITADDAIALRRQIVARLDELHPAGEQQAMQTGAAPAGDHPVRIGRDHPKHKKMHALWRQVGLGGPEHREQRLTRTALIVGRDVESSADLTVSEAATVIGVLEADIKEQVQQ